MRTPLKAARAVALCLAAIAFTSQIVDAEPLPTKNTGPAPTQSVTPYSLSLSLGKGWNITSTGLPKTTVTFANSSSHTLAFFLTSALSHFTVEYKATKDDVTSSTGWQMLRSSRQPSPDTAAPGNPADTETFDILMKFAPKQEDKTKYEVSGFPMSEAGLYRITAFTKISKASELDGPESSPTVVRTFILELRSSSVIVRRTASGFVKVPLSANKQASAK